MTTRYVNTASSPGGDGTTNNTSGSTRAFASLNEAEAALPADITTGGSQDIWRIVCEGNGADTTAVTFSGTTTSASYYVEVWTDPAATYGRHQGTWNINKYRLSNSGAAITISDGYTRLLGLQIEQTASSGSDILDIGATSAIVSYCIIRKNGAGTANGGIVASVVVNPRIFNCLLYDITAIAIKIVQAGGNVAGVYNNTVVNCATGISGYTNSTVTAKNNLIRLCTTSASGTFANGTDYNATDNSSMGYTVTGGGNTHDRLSQTFTFVNEAGANYQLDSTDAGAKGYGVTDPGSGLFSDDIVSASRTVPWDIGAFKAATALGGTWLQGGFWWNSAAMQTGGG